MCYRIWSASNYCSLIVYKSRFNDLIWHKNTFPKCEKSLASDILRRRKLSSRFIHFHLTPHDTRTCYNDIFDDIHTIFFFFILGINFIYIWFFFSFSFLFLSLSLMLFSMNNLVISIWMMLILSRRCMLHEIASDYNTESSLRVAICF